MMKLNREKLVVLLRPSSEDDVRADAMTYQAQTYDENFVYAHQAALAEEVGQLCDDAAQADEVEQDQVHLHAA